MDSVTQKLIINTRHISVTTNASHWALKEGLDDTYLES